MNIARIETVRPALRSYVQLLLTQLLSQWIGPLVTELGGSILCRPMKVVQIFKRLSRLEY